MALSVRDEALILAEKSLPLAMQFLSAVLADADAPNKERLQAASMLMDRALGKPKQAIEQEIVVKREEISIDDAARRIAFALNSAVMNGQVIDGDFARLAQPEQAEML